MLKGKDVKPSINFGPNPFFYPSDTEKRVLRLIASPSNLVFFQSIRANLTCMLYDGFVVILWEIGVDN